MSKKASAFKKTAVVPINKFVDPGHDEKNGLVDQWYIHL